MTNAAIIVKLSNVRKHPNADKLQLASALGYTVVVGLEIKSGDLGIYFPDGTRIGPEFAAANNLVRLKDEAGNNIGGMFDNNRRVRTIKLRGDQDSLLRHVEELSQGSDPLDPTHIKEGVVIRIERAKPKFVKHKSFEFKVLEGIVQPPEEE